MCHEIIIHHADLPIARSSENHNNITVLVVVLVCILVFLTVIVVSVVIVMCFILKKNKRKALDFKPLSAAETTPNAD